VRVGGEVRAAQRRRARSQPADQPVVRRLPDRVDEAGARAAAAVDGGERAPDDAVRDPADGRARRAALTARGAAAIAAGRRHRAAVEAELARKLGAERVEGARQTLVDVLETLGGGAAVRSRRVRPPA
jgi:hypothetical protein